MKLRKINAKGFKVIYPDEIDYTLAHSYKTFAYYNMDMGKKAVVLQPNIVEKSLEDSSSYPICHTEVSRTGFILNLLHTLFKRKSFSYLAKPLILLACLLLPNAASAFKIDTHLWVAQQVYNDVTDDGKITVELNGRPLTIPVSNEVVEAIRNNKDAFFMGNIGPDALPDVVAGQMTVHPGLANGWKTSDWLMHLMKKSKEWKETKGSSVGTALTYGYLSHASADFFSHTYANQYSGGIFSLQDGESLIEQRHYALEAFIAKHSPPFLDNNGVDQGPPYSLVAPNDDVAEFVRDTLIYDPQASAEYAKEPTTMHLPAYTSYRNEILKASNDPLWRKIDVAVVQIIAAYYGYSVSEEEAEQLLKYMNEDVLPAVNKGIDLEQEKINKINEYVNRIDAAHVSRLNSTVEKLNNLHKTILDKSLDRLTLGLNEAECKNKCGDLHFHHEKRRCKQKCELLFDATDKIRRIDDELTGLREKQLEALNELRDQAIIVKDSSLRMQQSIVDLAQIVNSDTSPIKATLENWVTDLDTAMKEYVKAAANSMILTMDPNVGDLEHGALTPLTDWYNCYHLTIMGVPAPVGTGDCGFRGDFQTNIDAINQSITIIEDATALGTYVDAIPSPQEIRDAVTKLQEEAKQALKDAAINELKKFIPDEVRDIMTLMSEDMTDGLLNSYYSKPESAFPSQYNLIMIDDMAERVKAEMHITGNDSDNSPVPYDSSEYAVVYNSVVLAKLAMLDNAGLRLLAQNAGVSSSYFNGLNNIIAQSIASLDGNHQWMKIAPDYPNSIGKDTYVNTMEGHPGYFPESYGGPIMFKLWEPAVRDQLFRSLFIGPLSPGIDSPEELGLETILPSDYSYRPCNANPFPDDLNDDTCCPIIPLDSPMVATAYLDSEDKACAWYEDGTMSCGKRTDLNLYQKSTRYSLPEGYTPTDIVGITWIDSHDMACAWYKNGKVSCGKVTDLDSIRTPYNYTLAPGYQPSDIKGIGWVSSNNMACVVYDDKKYSCGRTYDLDSVAGAQIYGLPYSYYPNDILSFDWVSKDSMGCFWYTNGKVSCGTPDNMGNKASPAPYSTTNESNNNVPVTPPVVTPPVVTPPVVAPPSPMVATAYLDSENMACAWYANSTVSCGSINDLDNIRNASSYTLPSGYTPANIVGIAWVDSYHMACAWYTDGKASCGKTTDLDSIRTLYNYTLPPGYRPSNIKGIGWVSSPNEMACAVYDDKRFSCGTTRDLDSVAGTQAYGLPYGYYSNDILSFDWVSKNSMGCFWYTDGKVSCGTQESMSNIRPPAPYSTTN